MSSSSSSSSLSSPSLSLIRPVIAEEKMYQCAYQGLYGNGQWTTKDDAVADDDGEYRSSFVSPAVVPSQFPGRFSSFFCLVLFDVIRGSSQDAGTDIKGGEEKKQNDQMTHNKNRCVLFVSNCQWQYSTTVSVFHTRVQQLARSIRNTYYACMFF